MYLSIEKRPSPGALSVLGVAKHRYLREMVYEKSLAFNPFTSFPTLSFFVNLF